MNFTHPPQTDEQKDASIQLNNIGTINALNTHNWELQQKIQMLNAENAKLREALHSFVVAFEFQGDENDADYIDTVYSGKFPVEAHDLRAARKALGDYK